MIPKEAQITNAIKIQVTVNALTTLKATSVINAKISIMISHLAKNANATRKEAKTMLVTLIVVTVTVTKTYVDKSVTNAVPTFTDRLRIVKVLTYLFISRSTFFDF